MLTCPDPEIVTYLTENTMAFGEGVPERTEEEIADAERAREAFGDYLLTKFPEDAFADAFRTDLSGDAYMNMIFPIFCVNNGKTITVESVTAELQLEKSRIYTYTAELRIEDKNGQVAPFTQSGRVQLDEEGKICYIDPDFETLCAFLVEE